jgi:exo-beta-1,3-glucanase (GH17 family)
MVLEVIKDKNLDLKVMLGAWIAAEINNEGCPWGGFYSAEELAENRQQNLRHIDKLIDLANRYPDIVCSSSAGNEATVDWTDHLVPVESVIEYVRKIKANTQQPVTFCENYVPWLDKLKPLVDEVDFISIHTYPVWEYKSIDEAMDFTDQNYHAVADLYPHKQVVITEAGWTTNANGQGIDPANVNEEFQKTYYEQLMAWSKEKQVVTFVFEAFDESWKGSDDPAEPEKHWGLFYINRKPKEVMREKFPTLYEEMTAGLYKSKPI